MNNAYRCPVCGEHVTPFAAGCAYCGADLDPRRRQRREGLTLLPRIIPRAGLRWPRVAPRRPWR